MAVNLTKNPLRIFDTPAKGRVSLTSVEILPEENSYINLHSAFKPKLYVETEGFLASEALSFQEVGIQNIIKMKEKLPVAGSNRDLKQKDQLRKIELGSIILPGEAPYEKTKILRIVQRTVLINQLN